MSADQNQHYLPQSYQRGWADTSKRVHVYEWRRNELICKPRATKKTGGERGLYFIPMAPPGQQNMMEDVFWKKIDQWGADGLALLRTNDPSAESQVNRKRLAVFIMSFLFRNPIKVAYFNAQAREWVTTGCLKDDYATHRRSHEPATFEEFRAALYQKGMTELAAETLRKQVFNQSIREQLLTMDWQVVTLSNSTPLLTSDVPLITYKGLKHDDGCWILPLSGDEFFVAFNRGKIDMKSEINAAVQSGQFVESMNKFVVQHKINFVYGIDDSQKAFVARHWAVSAVSAPV